MFPGGSTSKTHNVFFFNKIFELDSLYTIKAPNAHHKAKQRALFRTSQREVFGKCVSRRYLKNVACCRSTAATLTSRGSRTSPEHPWAGSQRSVATQFLPQTWIPDCSLQTLRGSLALVSMQGFQSYHVLAESQPPAAASWPHLWQILFSERYVPCLQLVLCLAQTWSSLKQLLEERGHFTLARFLHSSTTILRNPAAAA